jgi:hypothetical protein
VVDGFDTVCVGVVVAVECSVVVCVVLEVVSVDRL